MAVYKKTYRPYDGELTATFTRFLVIPRYAFEEMRKSRFLTIFFIASFIYPLICVADHLRAAQCQRTEPARRAGRQPA